MGRRDELMDDRSRLKERWGRFLLFFVGATVGAFVSLLVCSHEGNRVQEDTHTEVYDDTITAVRPDPVDAAVTGTSVYRVPREDVRARGCDASPCAVDSPQEVDVAASADVAQRDTVEIELPTVQRHYRDSLWEAWVSGPLDPRLDSVRVVGRREVTTVTRRIKERDKRWHLGVTAGVGYTPRGVGPYVGVGVTWSIVSF